MGNRVIKMDEARGFDVMRGKNVIQHYDTYEAAKKRAAERLGLYIRYWAAKPTKA